VKPLGPVVLLTARPRARLFHLVFGSHIGRALGADSGEKSGLASDIDTATVESLNALDSKRPIREAVSFNDPERTCGSPTMVIESVLKQRRFRFSRR
jgi:hypothetical protein